jgi:hypothetical protein
MVDIKGRLIRDAEYGIIIDELDLKKVFNLIKRLEKRLPYHSRSDLVQRREVRGHIIGQSPSSHSMIR